jgi:UDP-N-acetylmuramoyl-tripeptide--D-alanyl-D-alanine ligase
MWCVVPAAASFTVQTFPPGAAMDPISLTQLLTATHGDSRGFGGEDRVFTRISTDTRTLRAGDLFWALKGENFDGHQFASEAMKKGAAACVVARWAGLSLPGPFIEVEDTLKSLGDLAHWYRHQRESLVIGVTGSVGKTSTREMIHAVLSARHSGVQSQSNHNNLIGLPLSLLSLGSEHEFGVLEMGACRIGDIRQLCDIAYPEVGVIPKVGLAHVGTFGGIDQVFQGKGELLEALPPHGFAVVGGDDDKMRALGERAVCQTIFVGEKPGNTIRATDVEVLPGKLKFSVDRKKYEVPVGARHYLTAALCALAVAREIGMEHSAIAAGFKSFKGQPGRFQPERLGAWTVVDDTYNANPTSMWAACESLAEMPTRGRRLLVCGDMLELGPNSEQWHRETGACATHTKVDFLLTLGDRAAAIADGAVAAGLPSHRVAQCSSLETLQTVLDCWLGPDDIVLVKGSRGAKMERVVEWLRQITGHDKQGRPLDSRAVA